METPPPRATLALSPPPQPTMHSHRSDECPSCGSKQVRTLSRPQVVCGASFQLHSCAMCNVVFEVSKSQSMVWTP